MNTTGTPDGSSKSEIDEPLGGPVCLAEHALFGRLAASACEPGLTVYVDNAFAVGDWGRWTGGGHLQADTSEELHEFAGRIGLRREWFQAKPGRPEKDHYDLTRNGRARALELGAVDEDRAAGARRRRATREKRLGQPAEASKSRA